MAEHLDAFRAVAALGLGDRAVVQGRAARHDGEARHRPAGLRRALRSLLLRSRRGDRRGRRATHGRPMQLDARAVPAAAWSGSQRLLSNSSTSSSRSSPQALLQNDTGRLEQHAARRRRSRPTRGDIEQRAIQEGRFSHSTAQRLGLGALAEELERLDAHARRADLPPRARRALQRVHRPAPARPARDDPPHGAPRAREAAISRRASAADCEPRREELLLSVRGRDAAHAGGGHQAGAAAQERGVDPPQARASAASSTSSDTLRKNLQYGGVPFRIQFDRSAYATSRRCWCCATSPTRCATCRASCCSSSTRCRTSTRGCAASSSSARSARSTQLFEENDTQQAIEQALTGNVDQRLRALRLRPRLPDLPPRLPRRGRTSARP